MQKDLHFPVASGDLSWKHGIFYYEYNVKTNMCNYISHEVI
jgi:hypothetical protein